MRWNSNPNWKIVPKLLKELYLGMSDFLSLVSCDLSFVYFWSCVSAHIGVCFMSQCPKQNPLELNFYYSGAICLILGSCWKSSLHRQEMYIECFYHLQFDWVDQLGFMLSNMLVLCRLPFNIIWIDYYCEELLHMERCRR